MAATEQFTEMPFDELEPHPLNEQIYNTESRGVGDLVERIEAVGFRGEHRILVTPESHFTDADWTIISGHRRVEACKQLGIATVPVERVEYETLSAEQANVILANTGRVKNAGEKARETAKLLAAERARAKERKQNPLQEFAEGETGLAREKVGEKMGYSGETVRKIEYVVKKAQQLNPVAQEQLELLDNDEQSFSGAYQAVKNAEKQERDGPPRSTRELDDEQDADTTGGRDESPSTTATTTADTTDTTPETDDAPESDLPTCSTVARDDRGLIIDAGGTEYRLPSEELP